MTNNSFSMIELLKGPIRPSNYAKTIVFLVCGVVLIGIVFSVINTVSGYFYKKPSTSSTSVGTVEAGGVSTITNINNPSQELKQGLYLRGASDRASIGVFKEVMPHVDISIGGGKDYDDDAFVEAEIRFKF